jgi:hypothetical protein
MARFIWTAVVLQLATVLIGHFVETVLNVGGVLGTLIPFAVALVYGTDPERTFGALARGGLAIGVVSSVAGVLVALLLGDTTWLPLTWAPGAAALSGWAGAVIGRVRAGTPAET